MDAGHPRLPPHEQRSRLARLLLAAFLLTFLLARIIVLLIMTRRMPDLFLYIGGTHVHHLDYGIVLLAASGAWLLFASPTGRARTIVAVVYAVGLALTFDEFGMWLHLGGSYWQRAGGANQRTRTRFCAGLCDAQGRCSRRVGGRWCDPSRTGKMRWPLGIARRLC